MKKFDIKISSKEERKYITESIESDIISHLKEHHGISRGDIEEIIRHVIDDEKKAMQTTVSLFYEAIFEDVFSFNFKYVSENMEELTRKHIVNGKLHTK